jgi:valyl-tRNA synthetase
MPVNPGIYNKTIEFFTELMQLLHPFMPFVTEEIYHLLDARKEDLMMSQFAEVAIANTDILQKGELLKSVISGLRDVRVKNNIKPKEHVRLYIVSDNARTYSEIQDILVKQVNINGISHVEEAVANTISIVIGTDKFFIETETAVDNSGQVAALSKELEYLKGFLVSVEKKLGNERFVANAKPDVIALEQQKKADTLAKMKAIEDSLASLGAQ